MISAHKPPPSVVAPGNHDGVHLGHRALVSAARERAERDGLRAIALFFDPHPTRVLAPERAPTLLTTPARRAEVLRGAGADEVVVMPFDEEFAATKARAFAEDVLGGACNARCVVVGPDFHFGKNREGNVDTLRELGATLGYEVIVVPPVVFGEATVSSTRIRKVLAEGHVERAAAMLARVHDVDGTVVTGQKRGRTIGFPTANLACDDVVLPGDGVYAVIGKRVDADGPLLRGVANLGVRPTLRAGRSVEAHFFDFDGDLYGARMRVGFVQQLRRERKFPGIDELRTQIRKDADEARRALEAAFADPARRGWLSWL
jgi:riboflavin kinase / FMN adenylyltransferase